MSLDASVHRRKGAVCRVCSSGGLLTSITRCTRICNSCMRADVLTLPHDGSLVRFCYGHRQLEPLDSFVGKKTRCGVALGKLKVKRDMVKAAKKKAAEENPDAALSRKKAKKGKHAKAAVAAVAAASASACGVESGAWHGHFPHHHVMVKHVSPHHADAVAVAAAAAAAAAAADALQGQGTAHDTLSGFGVSTARDGDGMGGYGWSEFASAEESDLGHQQQQQQQQQEQQEQQENENEKNPKTRPSWRAFLPPAAAASAAATTDEKTSATVMLLRELDERWLEQQRQHLRHREELLRHAAAEAHMFDNTGVGGEFPAPQPSPQPWPGVFSDQEQQPKQREWAQHHGGHGVHKYVGQPRVTAQLLQLLETGGEFDVNRNQPQPQPQPQQPERGAPLRPPLEHHPTSMDDAALKVDFELVPEVVKEMMGEMNRDCGNLSAPESRGDGDDAGIYSGAVRPVSVTMNNGDAFHAQLEGAGAGTGARAGAVAWAASPVRASASDGDASSDRDSLPVPAVPVTTSGALAQDGWGDDILWGFTDRWLTPGSIILHKLSMPDVGGEAEESPSPNKIESLAKSLAAGKLFDMCASNADETGEVPIYVSRDGRAVRVHRNGSTTPIRHVGRSFLGQMLSACQVTCSSPSVRCVDVMVPGVPPGIKFEGRFHNSTLLRVEEISRHPSSSPSSSSSSFPSAPALAPTAANGVSSGTKEDVRIRIHLPNCGVGVARVEAVWSHGPCRNMPFGAGFPMLVGTMAIDTSSKACMF